MARVIRSEKTVGLSYVRVILTNRKKNSKHLIWTFLLIQAVLLHYGPISPVLCASTWLIKEGDEWHMTGTRDGGAQKLETRFVVRSISGDEVKGDLYTCYSENGEKESKTYENIQFSGSYVLSQEKLAEYQSAFGTTTRTVAGSSITVIIWDRGSSASNGYYDPQTGIAVEIPLGYGGKAFTLYLSSWTGGELSCQSDSNIDEDTIFFIILGIIAIIVVSLVVFRHKRRHPTTLKTPKVEYKPKVSKADLKRLDKALDSGKKGKKTGAIGSQASDGGMETVCPACGKKLQLGVKFCNMCGHRFDE